MQITMASQNEKKLIEIREKLPDMDVLGLDPSQFPEELVEDGDTLEANALQKVRQVFSTLGTACFADDTGLEIKALNGEPGVYSARYAGESKSSEANMDKVLSLLQDVKERAAQFRTVIALVVDGHEHLFEGICKGTISTERMGNEGFGYDPIFIPDGFDRSFAQMSMKEKNAISHRARAVDKLVRFLKEKRSEL